LWPWTRTPWSDAIIRACFSAFLEFGFSAGPWRLSLSHPGDAPPTRLTIRTTNRPSVPSGRIHSEAPRAQPIAIKSRRARKAPVARSSAVPRPERNIRGIYGDRIDLGEYSQQPGGFSLGRYISRRFRHQQPRNPAMLSNDRRARYETCVTTTHVEHLSVEVHVASVTIFRMRRNQHCADISYRAGQSRARWPEPARCIVIEACTFPGGKMPREILGGSGLECELDVVLQSPTSGFSPASTSYVRRYTHPRQDRSGGSRGRRSVAATRL
jgi:hypothetical protein